MKEQIFICYRRNDSKSEAESVYKALCQQLGKQCVFMDVSSIEAGVKWPDKIKEALANASAVIVIIGPKWVGTDEWGSKRRIDDSNDWVRQEIVFSLKNKKIIPLRIKGTEMPPKEVLPKELYKLSEIQSIELKDNSVEEIIDLLDSQSKNKSSRSTQLDKDLFLKETFIYIKQNIHERLQKIEKDSNDINIEFDEVNKSKFFATIYEKGTVKNKCKIWISGSSFADSILYQDERQDIENDNYFSERFLITDIGESISFQLYDKVSKKISISKNNHFTKETIVDYSWNRLNKSEISSSLPSNNKNLSDVPRLLFGTIFGFFIAGFWPKVSVEWFKPLGEIYLKILLLLTLPLIITSLMTLFRSYEESTFKGIAKNTFFYMIITTAMGALLGIIIATSFGYFSGSKSEEFRSKYLPLAEYIIEDDKMILDGANFSSSSSIYKDSYVFSLDQDIKGKILKTENSNIKVHSWSNAKGSKKNSKVKSGNGVMILYWDITDKNKVKLYHDAFKSNDENESTISRILHYLKENVPSNLFKALSENNLFTIMFFSLLFGYTYSKVPNGNTIIELSFVLQNGIRKVFEYIGVVAPFGIFFLVAGVFGESGGFEGGFGHKIISLKNYIIIVMIGLGIHGIIVLPGMYYFFVKNELKGVFQYLWRTREALSYAFGSASSIATFSKTYDAVTNKNKVPEKIANFVLPLGMTFNMNGTALYQATTVVFLIQLSGGNLSFLLLIGVLGTTILASIITVGIPAGGLVSLLIVLKAAEIPESAVSLVLIVDWLLDRVRTTINVWGDVIGAAVIAQLENNKN